MKKYEDKGGRIKDSLKGIIMAAVGALLVVIGIVWISILPLAIVLWVIGVPMAIRGVGLIINNKKNNTTYVSDKPSTSSSSSSSSGGSYDWELKFRETLGDVRFATADVRVDTEYKNNTIYVNVTIIPGWSDTDVTNAQMKDANDFDGASRLVKDAYKKLAKKCPFASELYIERG